MVRWRSYVAHDAAEPTIFGITNALNGSYKDGLTDAARAAIQPSQQAFRATAFGQNGECVPCAECGQATSQADSHVHHVPPIRFRDILALWCESNGKPAVRYVSPQGFEIEDPKVRQAFAAFHDDMCDGHRAMVCKPCNLTIG